MAIIILSAGRIAAAKGIDCYPIAAPFMYPIMSLKIFNRYGSFIVGMIS